MIDETQDQGPAKNRDELLRNLFALGREVNWRQGRTRERHGRLSALADLARSWLGPFRRNPAVAIALWPARPMLRGLRGLASSAVRGGKTLMLTNRARLRQLATAIIARNQAMGVLQSPRILAFLVRLVKARIPIVSGMALRIIHLTMLTLSSLALSAGDLERATRFARVLNIAFRPYILRRQQPTSYIYFQILFYCRQYERIVRETHGLELIDSHYLCHILGVAHLYTQKPRPAIFYLRQAIHRHAYSYPDHRMLGRAQLLLGNERAAALAFRRSVELAPSTVMAHQNYAGRYDIGSYKPEAWELRRAGTLLIYDNYGQLAEDFFLLGEFEVSFRCYQKMLTFQARFKRDDPLPASVKGDLARRYPGFKPRLPVRLLPYEWVTQFGHIGLLDIYLKMTRLGMVPKANYVLLAPPAKVVNEDFLALFEQHFIVVRDQALVQTLFPWQRLLGDNFMAYPGEGELAEPWVRAGARAQVAWAEGRRKPFLTLDEEAVAEGEAALRKLGVPKGAWYVGLHVRESGYYAESSGSISTHRNASVEDYFGAVRAITERGGIVIRLGDASMRQLPPMKGVIDYAKSPQKSPRMDIFLCATSRFVIGTTSGLTTACLCFDTPMLLANCISNDHQMWSAKTDFILKRVRDAATGRFLSLSETYRQPMQGRLINNLVMQKKGYEIVHNRPEEIEEAVCYKLDLVEGKRRPLSHPLMKQYRTVMAHNEFMFGAAHPCLPWLERHVHLTEPFNSDGPDAVNEAAVSIDKDELVSLTEPA